MREKRREKREEERREEITKSEELGTQAYVTERKMTEGREVREERETTEKRILGRRRRKKGRGEERKEREREMTFYASLVVKLEGLSSSS